MKLKLISFIITITATVNSQTPCSNGFAGNFPCDGYDLQSQIDLLTFNATRGNDSWGWTDPLDGKEYAIVCLDNGTVFIDISNPINPVYLGKLPTHTGNSSWRDAKVYDNYAFIVSDGNDNHGMQIFDLTRLRNVATPPETFTNDAHYNGFGSAHNIVINEDKGYAYVVGTSTVDGSPDFDGGPHIVDINNPLNPTFVAGYALDGYTHDAQVVVYSGPDTEHVGKELLIGSNTNEVVILDVTNKFNIQKISGITYTDVAYTHQGWFTEDHRFFLVGDEVDEISFGFNTRTIIFDFTDLDNPVHHMDYYGPTEAIDHNGYVKGDQFFLANYAAGLRVIDISDIQNLNLMEEGYFNTYPENDNAGFSGAWSVYPYFSSNNIVISDINRGFFLVKDPNALSVETVERDTFSMFPNPAENFLTVTSQYTPIATIQIYNTLGRQVMSFTNQNTNTRTINVSTLSSGMYFININGISSKKFIKN